MSRGLSYSMTLPVYQRLKSRGNPLTCHKCSKQVNVGDHVQSRHMKRGSGKCHPKIYHESCWFRMFY